jgi:hypothetical protein
VLSRLEEDGRLVQGRCKEREGRAGGGGVLQGQHKAACRVLQERHRVACRARGAGEQQKTGRPGRQAQVRPEKI